MTTESQKAFKEWAGRKSLLLHMVCGEYVGEYPSWAWKGWQASEARIRAMLESEEMMERVAKELLDSANKFTIDNHLAPASDIYQWEQLQDSGRNEYLGDAKAALKAIVEKL